MTVTVTIYKSDGTTFKTFNLTEIGSTDIFAGTTRIGGTGIYYYQIESTEQNIRTLGSFEIFDYNSQYVKTLNKGSGGAYVKDNLKVNIWTPQDKEYLFKMITSLTNIVQTISFDYSPLSDELNEKIKSVEDRITKMKEELNSEGNTTLNEVKTQNEHIRDVFNELSQIKDKVERDKEIITGLSVKNDKINENIENVTSLLIKTIPDEKMEEIEDGLPKDDTEGNISKEEESN